MSAPKSPWGNGGNNDDKGEQKSPPKNPFPPRNHKPQNGGQRPPNSPGGKRPRGDNIEDLFRNSQDRLKKQFGDGNDGKLIVTLAVIGLAIWILSGFYRVESDQIGVELTFGEWTNEKMPAEPGLHYHWPTPVGKVFKPVVTRENRTPVGFSISRGSSFSSIRQDGARQDVPSESLMLTGDENIVDIDFIVFWRIKDAGAYLFNVRDPVTTVKISSESAMREVIGQRPIIAALTERRREIEQETIARIQRKLDDYGTGVLIKNVQLLDVAPPQPVVDAFNDVQRARADKERLIEEARAYANEIIPKAKGVREQILQDAEAYKQQVVSKSKGDAGRFNSVYNSYVQAKDVTRQRLYLEAMEEVLQNASKIVIDSDASKSGVVPFFPIDQLKSAK